MAASLADEAHHLCACSKLAPTGIQHASLQSAQAGSIT
jgi:hypothetical protein